MVEGNYNLSAHAEHIAQGETDAEVCAYCADEEWRDALTKHTWDARGVCTVCGVWRDEYESRGRAFVDNRSIIAHAVARAGAKRAAVKSGDGA